MNRYYAVLGLSPTATKEEVRRKYRQLVLQWHPDRNSSPGAQEKFVQITEAYDILMGERAAPRLTMRSYAGFTRAQSVPKSPYEQRQEKRKIKANQVRRQFEKIRTEHRTAPDAEARRVGMYRIAYLYFILAGLSAVVAIAGPILLGSVLHIVWAMPLGLGGGAQLLWRGGRYKLRADMIYSDRTNFSAEEIDEFFVDGFGIRGLRSMSRR